MHKSCAPSRSTLTKEKSRRIPVKYIVEIDANENIILTMGFSPAFLPRLLLLALASRVPHSFRPCVFPCCETTLHLKFEIVETFVFVTRRGEILACPPRLVVFSMALFLERILLANKIDIPQLGLSYLNIVRNFN